MGTPSGSKNQSLFMDRMEIIGARDFDGGTYHGPGADPADPYYDKKRDAERQLEKQMKNSEANEFKNLKFEASADIKTARIATMMPKPVPAGPSTGPATKRKLPTFVKKVKDDAVAERKQEPEEKRARNEQDNSNSGKSTAAVGAGLVPASPAPTASPAASPAASVGGLLGGYDSDDSDDE